MEALKPQIIIGGNEGVHNSSPETLNRLDRQKSYKDLSTVIVIVSRGQVDLRVTESWMSLMRPMNQKVTQIAIAGMEVGAGYSAAVENILVHPEIKDWRYMLTLEEDNMPPPDGLLKLYESMEDYDVVGGLYWTKGEEGQPMIYGNVKEPINFVPQRPEPDTIQPCHGLGMGFTLFKLDLFREGKLDKPYFQTVQSFDPYEGGKGYSQDLHFFERAGKLGYKFACDTRVKVGHLAEDGTVW